MPEASAYAVLGVAKGINEKDLKTAYVNMVKKYDPEKHTERFMVIQQAYDRLRQVKTRAKEDVYTYNTIRGEFLFLPEEKWNDEAPPSDELVNSARAKYRESAGSEETRTAYGRVLMSRAHYAIARKQLADAIRHWTDLLEIMPTHLRCRQNLEVACGQLGLTYALHGLLEDSIELLERALQFNPDNTDIVHNLALVTEKASDAVKAGKYWAETVARWKQLLDKQRDNEYLRHCITEALNHHGDYLDAHRQQIASATRKSSASVQLPKFNAPPQPMSPVAQNTSTSGASVPLPMPSSVTVTAVAAAAPAPSPQSGGNVTSPSISLGSPTRRPVVPAAAAPKPAPGPVQPSAMLDRYKEIARLNPEDFEPNFQYCNKLMEEQLYPTAQEELMKLVKKHPKNTEVLNTLGWALLNMGQKDQAFAAWDRSLAIDPKNASTREQMVRAHLNMGKSFRAKGLFTPALVHFKKLLTLMPKSPEVHLEIAATYDMKGDVRSAVAEYNAVLELDPKNKVAKKAVTDLKMKR